MIPTTSSFPISGLLFEPRRVINDPRGSVLHYLRADSPLLPRFGEVYLSTIHCGAIKAWKRHHRVAQLLTVPVGCVRFVAYDGRADSISHGQLAEIQLQRGRHGVLHVPAGLWYGFQGLAPGESLIVNCLGEIHDPAESDRLPDNDVSIPYLWPRISAANDAASR